MEIVRSRFWFLRTSAVPFAGLLTAVAMAQGVPTSTQGAAAAAVEVVTVITPEEKQAAVKLSGGTANLAPETWETRLQTGQISPGVASTSHAEVWVRNVSQPTLEPFLADPSKATGAAMIVAPGGGFTGLAIEREGYAVAQWLNVRGIAAFVLKYRLASTNTPPRQAPIDTKQTPQRKLRPRTDDTTAIDLLSPAQRAALQSAQQDGLEAVRYVRAHAGQWEISPNRIGIIGFSAGAVTALAVALKADQRSRPDLIASIYGVLPDRTAVPLNAPPAFIAVATDDAIGSQYSLAIYNAWRAAGATAELHMFETGGHGFGMLHQGKSSDQWPQLLDHWLTAHEF